MQLQVALVASLVLSLAWAENHQEPARFDGYKLLRVVPHSLQHVQVLHDLYHAKMVDLWTEPRMLSEPVLFHVGPSSFDVVSKNLTSEGLSFNVTISDLQKVFDDEKLMFAPHSEKEPASHANIDLTRYNTYEEINQYLDAVVARHIGLASIVNVARTYEGRALRGVRLSLSGSASKDVVLLEFGVHAREWIAPAAGLFILNTIVNEYQSNPRILAVLKKYDLIIIPSTNPDGYVHSHRMNRLWRKNRAPTMMAGCIGTDLNRNFDVQFGVGWPELRQPCHDLYSGDFIFSEKETQGLRDLMLSLGRRLKVYFAVHAFSQYWMFPYGYTKQLPPNFNELNRVSKAGVDAILQKHGLSFRYGTIANVIYEATGSSADWAYLKTGAKMSFALELRDRGTFGFALPRNQILPACEETWAGILAALEAI